MSIERCEKHSRPWDSDEMEMCPICEDNLPDNYDLDAEIEREAERNLDMMERNDNAKSL